MYLVTGATGNVGAEVVAALAGAGEPVRALVRDPARASLPAGAEAVGGDLNEPASLTDALAGVRALFLLPGYEGLAGTCGLALRAGVERVVLLSGGSAETGDLENAVARYMILSEQAVENSGLPWTFLRPRSFMSNALRWIPQLEKGDVVRVPFAEVPTASIDPADIAAVAVAALMNDGHEGAVYDLTGPEPLLPAEQVAVLAEELGRDLRCEGLSDEEARAEMSASMPAAYVDAFFAFFVDGLVDEQTVYPTVREVTGHEPRTFRQWAKAHADAFRVGGN
ncbi:NAD(P)H-binding protein [Streptomyces specialis]|uniref:NAD(P)H-binding protein n=1 Tax=Streptomyces specialis TaxID=498367 RepID=UPI00073F4370|nr:NAD(P)H-binding protein [Streptomyces specialis]